MAYTHPSVAFSSFRNDQPTPVRLASGAPVTADSSPPADNTIDNGIFNTSGFSRVRFGLLLDGGASPTATVVIYQYVTAATSWITLDTQSAKASGYSWEVNLPPGVYYASITAVTNSPTSVCVTAQAAERF